MLTEDDASLSSILNALKNAEIIVYPTEAVFGLGCDPDSWPAVQKLLQLKNRTVEKGFILIAANYAQLLPYIDDSLLTPPIKQKVLASWPGPITWLLPAHNTTPQWLTGKHASLAVRVSSHPAVQRLCLAYGKPIISTSANLTGHSPCCTVAEIRQQFGYQLALLSGDIGSMNKPTEIKDALTGNIIRQG